MFNKMHNSPERNEGFSLIELTIGVAIIGLLTAVAAPKFIVYCDRARTAAALASGTRGTPAAVAADYPNSLYIEDAKVTKASDLNQYGTTLQDNTYKNFTYKQLNGGFSYQLEIVTLDNQEVCLKPEGLRRQNAHNGPLSSEGKYFQSPMDDQPAILFNLPRQIY